MSQDQKRAEKLSKRVNAIQDVNESVSLLTQLLEDYDRTTNPQSNAELIQVWGTFTQARDTSHSAITASPIYDVYKALHADTDI